MLGPRTALGGAGAGVVLEFPRRGHQLSVLSASAPTLPGDIHPGVQGGSSEGVREFEVRRWASLPVGLDM